MTKRFHLLAACAAACLGTLAAPASALVLLGTPAGGAAIADYSGIGVVSFDADFTSPTLVPLQFRIESADLLAPVSFNAVIRNFTGSGLDGLSFLLDGATFASAGSVTRSFGSTQLDVAATYAALRFAVPEYLDVEIGNALGRPGATDWTLSLAGRSVGDVITMQVVPAAVAEPPLIALVAGGLGLLAWARRRRG
ncbi:PEP-CTERM sorting domain-containing protein [Schlegelella sp. ID0723]|uniref:PEP-CTERM sorting domain-containing protein n=2 Tax=Piscinibacter koreensis TaxID=2742824 RepID=A0A7Y6NNK5_9BURK|nr:PEP-CTERM sorting domain-containing protein [Schlegelella koreensis]